MQTGWKGDIYVRKRSDSLRADIFFVSWVHTLKTFKMLTVLLTFATVMVSLPSSGSQSQPTGVQCSSAVTQFSMVQQGPIQEYCREIQYRFNDTAYRIDFTQSEVDQICNDDVCLGVLQQLVISCNTFVSWHNTHDHLAKVTAGTETKLYDWAKFSSVVQFVEQQSWGRNPISVAPSVFVSYCSLVSVLG